MQKVSGLESVQQRQSPTRGQFCDDGVRIVIPLGAGGKVAQRQRPGTRQGTGLMQLDQQPMDGLRWFVDILQKHHTVARIEGLGGADGGTEQR